MKKVYELQSGDNREILPLLIKQGVLVDSIVTDPPYEIGFMGKGWDKTGIANDVEFWKLCYQILKPGGHLLSFSSTRTYHRMTCAIEDAGFEIRDQIGWLYGSGFPKSHNISKAIDKHLGKEGVVVGKRQHPTLRDKSKIDRLGKQQFHGANSIKDEWDIVAPESTEVKKWQGWGSALKPAWEPIVLARKPLDEKSTLAENVLKHGTGGLNIDASRIPTDSKVDDKRLGGNGSWNTANMAKNVYGDYAGGQTTSSPLGRFPANIIHDGSEEVLEEFAKYGTLKSGSNCVRRQEGYFGAGDSKNGGLGDAGDVQITYGDSGSAARFFYSAKATKEDRAGSEHTTVKPVSLMSYLCKLVTPPGGIILDPFAGSGTTGQAAVENGFYPILIEREPQYQQDIKNRMSKFEDDTFYTMFE